MKCKIIPGMFSKNSCPLVLTVLDNAGNACGIAYYRCKIGNCIVYTFDGRNFKLDLGALHAKT